MKALKIALISIGSILALGLVLFGLMAWGEDLPANSNGQDTSQLEQKFMDALLGDGVMEITGQDVNGMAGMMLDGGEGSRIKGAYIDFADDMVQARAIVSAMGMKFFVKAGIKPYMSGKDIMLKVDSVTVGKLPIPAGLAVSLLQAYLPDGYKVADGNSINIGNRILMFDIKDLSMSGGNLRVELLKDKTALVVDDKGQVAVNPGSDADTISQLESGTDGSQNAPASSGTDPGNSANTQPSALSSVQPSDNGDSKDQPPSQGSPKGSQTPSQGEDAANPSVPQTDQLTQKKIDALKTTNSQLYGVLGSVKSSQAKSWVSMVIAVNSDMIKNPGGDYSGPIGSAKYVYKNFPNEIKVEIKKAALMNMDTSSVMFLASAYGI